jgi:flagellar hook-basal body complex protein FliE
MINPLSSVAGPGAAAPVARPGPTAPAAGADFSKVLADVAGSTMDSLKAGETAAISGISGQRPLQQVVDSIMTAEQALNTALAVRDKLVAAYTEISRMAI